MLPRSEKIVGPHYHPPDGPGSGSRDALQLKNIFVFPSRNRRAFLTLRIRHSMLGVKRGGLVTGHTITLFEAVMSSTCIPMFTKTLRDLN